MNYPWCLLDRLAEQEGLPQRTPARPAACCESEGGVRGEEASPFLAPVSLPLLLRLEEDIHDRS